VNLPHKGIQRATPHGGEAMWYSNNDQSWADVRFWMWNNYDIEALWDYGFVEVSTDGGSTWTQLEVRDEAGNVVSTNEDPNGRLHDDGGLQNGLTGSTGDEWRHDYVNLTPYAGSTIGLRLRDATDAAFEAPGWFADDFEVTADGWTSEQGTFTDTDGAGWIITGGTFIYQQYYLAEWRNYDGFDKGLRYAYDTTYFNQGREWRVTRIPYNAPGMLVWYRDAQYTVNHVATPIFDPPSTGSKGQLLIVDSHFDPLRRSGEAAEHDPTTLKNLDARIQSTNAAFAKRATRPFRECIEDPARLVCHLLQQPPGPGRRPALHRRQGLVPGDGAARRGPVLPRRRRLGGGPLQGQPALHDPDRRREREPADRPVRHRPR
jgi:immune inhibitor A